VTPENSPCTRFSEMKQDLDLHWSGSIRFESFDPKIKEKPLPSFMEEEAPFPGPAAEVVDGEFGHIIMDEQGVNYYLAPDRELGWQTRPRVEAMVKLVVERHGFLEGDADYKALYAGGGMRGGKSIFLAGLGYEAAKRGLKVIHLRPAKARKADRHQSLIEAFPDSVELIEVEDIAQAIEVVRKCNVDLLIQDEINLITFGKSKALPYLYQRERAAVTIPEIAIARGIKYAGGLIERFATGEAFPPILEVLRAQRENREIEYFTMYPQCLCGAGAETQALTELYYWKGMLSDGEEYVVRPLVPIDQERVAVENVYIPVCSHCHVEIHGERAYRKWAVINYAGVRNYTHLDRLK